MVVKKETKVLFRRYLEFKYVPKDFYLYYYKIKKEAVANWGKAYLMHLANEETLKASLAKGFNVAIEEKVNG